MMIILMRSGSDAPCENSSESTEGDDEQEVVHPLPEVLEEVFSSMIDLMPRTKEEVVGWCSEKENDEDENVEEEPGQRNPMLDLFPSTTRSFIIDSKYYIVSFYAFETEMIQFSCSMKC